MHRTLSEKHRDRVLTSKLYLEGKTQRDIAAQINRGLGTVNRDIKVLVRYWRMKASNNIDQAKARELAKIDKLESEYWQAWIKSVGYKEVKTLENPVVGKGEKISIAGKESVKSWDEVGDPRYLAGVQWCIDKRCKILGIDAPQKVEHSGDLGLDITIEYVDPVDEAED